MTGDSKQTWIAAGIRAGWSVLATFVFAAGSNYLMLEGDLPEARVLKIAIATGAVAAAAPFAVRAGIEGAIDAHRQKKGLASPADVTPTPGE